MDETFNILGFWTIYALKTGFKSSILKILLGNRDGSRLKGSWGLSTYGCETRCCLAYWADGFRVFAFL